MKERRSTHCQRMKVGSAWYEGFNASLTPRLHKELQKSVLRDPKLGALQQKAFWRDK